jgi:hypothetical protein
MTFLFGLFFNHWFGSMVIIILCLYGMKRTNRITEFIAPILYICSVKSSPLSHFWYYILLPAFCLPIRDKWIRRILFFVIILVSLRDFYSIFIGPIGYQNPPNVRILLERVFLGILRILWIFDILLIHDV